LIPKYLRFIKNKVLSYVKTTILVEYLLKRKIIIFKTENTEGPWQVKLLNYVVVDLTELSVALSCAQLA
jgi:hypothetical protein